LSPVNGSGSHFQSPVCNIFPTGVSIFSPLGSSIECVNVTNSILKGLKSTMLFN